MFANIFVHSGIFTPCLQGPADMYKGADTGTRSTGLVFTPCFDISMVTPMFSGFSNHILF